MSDNQSIPARCSGSSSATAGESSPSRPTWAERRTRAAGADVFVSGSWILKHPEGQSAATNESSRQ